MTGAARTAPERRGLRATDPVADVPGVGGARAEVFARLGVATVDDLLRLAPRRFEDRRRVIAVVRARGRRPGHVHRPRPDLAHGARRGVGS